MRGSLCVRVALRDVYDACYLTSLVTGMAKAFVIGRVGCQAPSSHTRSAMSAD